MIHQWVYVIIPAFQHKNTAGGFTPPSPVYFAAYCKGCGDYFTEPMPVDKSYKQSTGNLPFDGCEGRRNTLEVPPLHDSL